MKNSYPALENFFGAYFSQDFDLDYGDPNGALSAFLAWEPREYIQSVCCELERAIREVAQLDEPETAVCDALGCYYLPSTDGLSVAEWLKHVHHKLREGMAAK